MTNTAHVRAVWCFVTVAALLSLVASATSTPDQPFSPQYVQERWAADRGFPGGKVLAITQTPDGFLWIGTDQGLSQLDGQGFSAAPASKFAPTPLAPVLGLLTDSLGEVWIRVGRDKLFRYSHGKLDDVLWLLHGEDAVTAMCLRKDGGVFLAGLVNGLLNYERGNFATLLPANALPHSPITAMVEAPDGRLWLGTQDRGIFYIKDGKIFPFSKGLPGLKISSLLVVGNDVWIGTERGIARWNGNAMTVEGVPPALRHERAFAMLLDRRSNLWVTTASGLYRFGTMSKSSFDVVSRAKDVSVTALFEDREANVWVGQAGSIERMQESRFTTFGRASGLPSDGIGPIYVDSKNRVWFALSDGGLYRLADGAARPVPVPGVNRQDVVYSITGSGTDLWIGKMRGGLTHLRVSNGAAVPAETLAEKNGLAQNSVFAVHQARDGTVWAGTVNGGVSQWKDGHFRTFSAANGLASNPVSAITETADGTIWVGTLKGLSAWSQDRWKSYGIPDGLPSETVNCLLEDSTGTLWIGTTEGLAVFRAGAVQAVANTRRRLRDTIFGLADDRRGFLWVVTSTSVMQVSRQKVLDGSLAATDVREYGLADGLPSLGGVRRDRSVIADAKGRIWIATNHGLAVVDPAALKSESSPTLTRIEGISADGSSINLTDKVRIPPGQQRIAFTYSGVNLSAPESVRFRYKLEGFDRDWREPTTQRETVYTNLAPRNYLFRVIASDREGNWDGSESTLAIVVEPEYWQTLWFRLIVPLALLVVAIGIYRRRLRRVARQLNLRFEERLAERSRIARELHDTLLQSFQGVLMKFYSITYLLPDRPAEAQETLETVVEQARRAINEGRDAVQGLRSSALVANDLPRAITMLGEELAAHQSYGSSADFHVHVEGTQRSLTPLLGDEVYRISGEALRNAFLHARARRIELEIRYDRRHFRVCVRDDGKGIDPKVLNGDGLAGHYGLAGMHERAKLVGGKLAVWSELGSGTEVELTIRGSVAYARKPRPPRQPTTLEKGA